MVHAYGVCFKKLAFVAFKGEGGFALGIHLDACYIQRGRRVLIAFKGRGGADSIQSEGN